MRTIKWLLAVVLCAAVVSTARIPALRAEEPARSTKAEQTSLHITIYNQNFGLVKDVRELSLPTGTHNVWFEGVAAQIDPTSVSIRSLTAPNDLTVLEQNFEYDLISPKRLMQKYLGQTVELIRTIDDRDETIQAKLIGTEGGYVYEIDGKIAVNPPGRVVLPSLPKGLISKPSLVWLLDNDRKKHTVEASYLTNGINWQADYVAILEKSDTKVDMSGWVTINNMSGATYDDATLKLVAGDVHRVQPERAREIALASTMEMSGARRPQFEEESFFEYHLYTLQRKATVKDNQTKQIGLLEASDIGIKKSFVYAAHGRYFISRMGGPDTHTKVGVYVSFDNAEKNNLGMPLPKGVVRMYKKDEDGALQFVGEDRIDHTPEDETIRLRMGNAFDIVAERVQTDYKVLASGHLYESSYKVTIRNHKDEDVTVQVVERLWGDWEVLNSSHEFEKESSHRIRFDIPVERKSSAELTFTVRVKY
jgi:hypothetical protein